MDSSSNFPPAAPQAQDSGALSGVSNHEVPYVSHVQWSGIRPHVLVIACSDGRLQEHVDDFLQNQLGITNYDRMFVPGGPGALTTGGYEFSRSDQLRHECAFLVEAHAIEEVILLFHGAAPDGVEEAACADYRRKFPGRSAAELNAQQQADVVELRRLPIWSTHARIRIFRAEVRRDSEVQFVDLSTNEEG